MKKQILTKSQEVELFKKIEQGDQQAKNQLAEANIKLVYSIVWGHLKKYGGKCPLKKDELNEEGLFGLSNAIEHFDWRKGCKFSTFAYKHIEGAIKKGIDKRIEEEGRKIRVSKDDDPNFIFEDKPDIPKKPFQEAIEEKDKLNRYRKRILSFLLQTSPEYREFFIEKKKSNKKDNININDFAKVVLTEFKLTETGKEVIRGIIKKWRIYRFKILGYSDKKLIDKFNLGNRSKLSRTIKDMSLIVTWLYPLLNARDEILNGKYFKFTEDNYLILNSNSKPKYVGIWSELKEQGVRDKIDYNIKHNNWRRLSLPKPINFDNESITNIFSKEEILLVQEYINKSIKKKYTPIKFLDHIKNDIQVNKTWHQYHTVSQILYFCFNYLNSDIDGDLYDNDPQNAEELGLEVKRLKKKLGNKRYEELNQAHNRLIHFMLNDSRLH